MGIEIQLHSSPCGGESADVLGLDAVAAGGHLHYDRRERVWRSHEEMVAVVPPAPAQLPTRLEAWLPSR